MSSFAQRVRDAIIDNIGDREFTAQDVALHMDLVFNSDKKPLYATLRDFRKRGDVVVVRKGVYRYVRRGKVWPAVIQGKMWRILRARRTVTVDDMMALAGASKGYAKEFLNLLVRQQIVRRIDRPDNQPTKYQMIADPVKMPINTEKAARLRAIRAAKKSAEKAIDQAAQSMIGATKALAKLKTALGDIPEESDDE